MAFLSPRKIFPQPKKRRNTPSDAKKNNPKNNFIPNVRKIKHSRDLAGDIKKIAVWSGGKGDANCGAANARNTRGRMGRKNCPRANVPR